MECSGSLSAKIRKTAARNNNQQQIRLVAARDLLALSTWAAFRIFDSSASNSNSTTRRRRQRTVTSTSQNPFRRVIKPQPQHLSGFPVTFDSDVTL